MIAPRNEFLAIFPWHVIVAQETSDEPKSVRSTGENTSFATATIGQNECLAIFTDRDLARRFIESTGMNGEIVQIQLPSVAITVLEKVPYSHVAFDSDLSTSKAYFLTREEAILQIRCDSH